MWEDKARENGSLGPGVHFSIGCGQTRNVQKGLGNFFIETQVSMIGFWLNHHLWLLIHSHAFTEWFT